MTHTDYAEFVTTAADMVYVNDLERLMRDHPERAAA